MNALDMMSQLVSKLFFLVLLPKEGSGDAGVCVYENQ